MPEQQASPSSSRPSSIHEKDYEGSPETASQSSKRIYLSLLPPPQLIDLILAIDENRQTLIFPHDLDSAIKALQRPQRLSQPPSPKTTSAVAVIVKAEPTLASVPPPIPPPALPPPQLAPPAQSPVVQPPQYKPPPHKQPPHVYPYTHAPYYSPPQPPQSHTSPPLPPLSAPQRHSSLFTSTPLTRDPNRTRPLGATPDPPVSSRDDPNAMPSYEEMIVEAIVDVGDGEGTPPKIIFAWMASHYPLQQNFRPSASQALHKALKRGRLEKIGGNYRLNSNWSGGPTTSKRATRRPTPLNTNTTPASHPRPAWKPPTAQPGPPPGYPHLPPAYGYSTYPYFPGAPHPYHAAYSLSGATWGGQPQTYPQPVNGIDPSNRADAMETDEGPESEEAEASKERLLNEVEADEGADTRTNEKIRQSLVRLARVLRRFADKGEGKEGDYWTCNTEL